MHAFFYSTAVTQGKSLEFDEIVEVLREYFTTVPDEANGNRPFSLVEVDYDLQEGDEAVLQNMASTIQAV